MNLQAEGQDVNECLNEISRARQDASSEVTLRIFAFERKFESDPCLSDGDRRFTGGMLIIRMPAMRPKETKLTGAPPPTFARYFVALQDL
jgi:hypothetical protein